MHLETDRLIIRSWDEETDFEPLVEMSADPEVMALLRGPVDRQGSADLRDRMLAHERDFGVTLWPCIAKESGMFHGLVGLLRVTFEVPFKGMTEVGWRLARHAWGKGYASEGARACLAHGFTTLDLEEIVAITVPHNTRSRAVMARIGMTQDMDGDFDHPLLAPDDPLYRHVLYRQRREDWSAA